MIYRAGLIVFSIIKTLIFGVRRLAASAE